MLKTIDVMAVAAVKDLAVAKNFYEGVLNLEIADTRDGVITFKSGCSTLLVYRSEYAGTNKATTAMWAVDHELEQIVRALKEKGVTFEHYDLPNTVIQGDIHVSGSMKVVWFKDPDGNILSLVSG